MYLYQKQQEAQKAQLAEQGVPKKMGKDKKEADAVAPQKTSLSQSDIKVLERKIQKLEHEISRTEHSFADLVFGTPKFADAQKKLIDLKKELESALAEWENSQN